MPRMIRILYPYNGQISDDKLVSWYLDLVADGEIVGLADVSDPEFTLQMVVAALEDIGELTVIAGQF